MQGTATAEAADRSSGLFGRVRDILLSARVATARSVNSAQVVCNWLIGREIVEDEQSGRRRAGYRARTLNLLAERLKREFGSGYSETNLKGMRTFYLIYPDLIRTPQIRHPLGDEILNSMIGKKNAPYAPGGISSNLSWRHYRRLMRIDSRNARSFYEIEAVKNSWSARELERQVASQLFERLALVDLKVGKLTHSDLGQLQLYVNFYDLERRAPDDNPTLGLILCSDKNDAVVKYTLGPNQEAKIFASRYKLHLPSEKDLRAQIQNRRKRLLTA
jgi:hypothetical protein